MDKIRTHKDLDVYQISFALAMDIYKLSKAFPSEEKYSLTDQIRRSSRSVSANIAEAFRKRLYPKHFISKISDSEAEAAETQVWIQFSWECNYLSEEECYNLDKAYDRVIGKLVKMRNQPEKWNIGY